MIELVVFDMAGTAVHDADSVNACLRAALARHGVEVWRDEVNRVMGLPKPVAIRTILDRRSAEAHATDAAVAEIHEDFVRMMIDVYSGDGGAREVDGATAVFRTLKSLSIKVVLDTGFSRPIADVILRRLRWTAEGAPDAVVDAVVTSDEVQRGRPAPDLVFEAMDRVGVDDPSRVAKVGDTPADLEEGTAAKCRYVIGVTTGSHTREELARAPHTHVVENLWDVVDLVRDAREYVSVRTSARG